MFSHVSTMKIRWHRKRHGIVSNPRPSESGVSGYCSLYDVGGHRMCWSLPLWPLAHQCRHQQFMPQPPLLQQYPHQQVMSPHLPCHHIPHQQLSTLLALIPTPGLPAPAPPLPGSAVVPTNADIRGGEPIDPAHNSTVSDGTRHPPRSAVAEQTVHPQNIHPAVAEDVIVTDTTNSHVTDIALLGPDPPPLVPLACGIASIPPRPWNNQPCGGCPSMFSHISRTPVMYLSRRQG